MTQFLYSEFEDDSGSDLDSFLPSHKRSPLVRRRGSLDSSSRGRVESASSTLTDLTENSSPRLANSHNASMYCLCLSPYF